MGGRRRGGEVQKFKGLKEKKTEGGGKGGGLNALHACEHSLCQREGEGVDPTVDQKKGPGAERLMEEKTRSPLCTEGPLGMTMGRSEGGGKMEMKTRSDESRVGSLTTTPRTCLAAGGGEWKGAKVSIRKKPTGAPHRGVTLPQKGSIKNVVKNERGGEKKRTL